MDSDSFGSAVFGEGHTFVDSSDSAAFGASNQMIAGSFYSLVAGSLNTIASEWSLVAGTGNYAGSPNTFSTVTPQFNYVFGYRCQAGGQYAYASGLHSNAFNDGATAIGYTAVSNAGWGTANGVNTIADADFSYAYGTYTTANSFSQTVLGSCNDVNSTYSSSTWVGTDPIFSVGVGLVIDTSGSGSTWNAGAVGSGPPFGCGTNVDGMVLNKLGALTVLSTVKAVAFIVSSDARLKTDILPLEDTLSKIEQLEPVSYHFKDPGVNNVQAGKKIGFTAQNLQKVFPEVVSTNEVTGMLQVSYSELSAVAIDGIKEQQILIKDQQQKIENLEAENDSLKALIKSLAERLTAVEKQLL